MSNFSFPNLLMSWTSLLIFLIQFITSNGRNLLIANELPNSKLSITQQVFDTVATSNAFFTNSGNHIKGQNITNMVGQDPSQFGMGLVQVAFNNNVTSTRDLSNSGNQIQLNNITYSTIVGVQDASQNYASGGLQADGNSGNVIETTLVAYSDLKLDQVATYNEAQTEGGEINSGNVGLIDEFIGGSAEVLQSSTGNKAFNSSGDVNTGNMFIFDTFASGRKLQKYDTRS